MSESPLSDPEKHAYPAESKTVHDDGTPVYADEALGETEVVEFTETKELR